jgi:FMN phosphatase YigB (HAD superfamily)
MSLGIVEVTPEAFARARIAAEQRAYVNLGVARTTLKDIYAELSLALHLSGEQCARIMNLECELEGDLLRVVPETRHRISSARSKDHQITFLSDIYLPANFVKEQLVLRELCDDTDRCYVSSEFGKLKATGELYREFLAGGQASPELVSHFGNDLEVDVKAATRCGLKTEHFIEGNLNRYERTLEDYAWETEGLSSVMAGAARLARLSVPVSSVKQQALREVAAGVIAPTLTGFILWLFARAQQTGIERLYFLSRDGQILIEMARRLAAKLNITCDLRYLYASRQALNLYGMVIDDDHLSSWIWDNTPQLSVRSFLARICLDPSEVRQFLESAGFSETDWSRNLNRDERLALRPLFQNPDFRGVVTRKVREKQEVVVKYLHQEGLVDGENWAIVDLGWHGSLQNSLAVVLSSLREKRPVGFYFGLAERPTDNRFGPREAYFFDRGLRQGFMKEGAQGFFVRMEMFCAGDHGTVTGYTDRGSYVQPDFKEEHNQAIITWGLPIVRETVCSFVDNLVLDPTAVNPKADVRPATLELLTTFWARPTFHEAAAWGEFPWEDGFGTETCVNASATAYKSRDVLTALWHGRIVLHHRASWHEACLILTPWRIRAMLMAAARFRRLLSNVKQRVLRTVRLLGISAIHL